MEIIALHGTSKKFKKFELNKSVSNSVYGSAPDNGLGIFFTDNEIMAKWFSGGIEYNCDVDSYISTENKNAFLIKSKLILNKILHFENKNEKFDDSYQQYFEFIEQIGGVEKCREKLLSAGYDSIMIHDANTNYYEDGTYNAFVILKLENIEILNINKL